MSEIPFENEKITCKASSINHGALSFFLRKMSLSRHLVQVVAHGAHLLFALHLGPADRLVRARLVAQALVRVCKLLLHLVRTGLLSRHIYISWRQFGARKHSRKRQKENGCPFTKIAITHFVSISKLLSTSLPCGGCDQPVPAGSLPPRGRSGLHWHGGRRRSGCPWQLPWHGSPPQTASGCS